MSAKRYVKAADREVVLRADPTIFARLCMLAQNHSMDTREVMLYSLGLLPLSFSTPDDLLVKLIKQRG